jgi:CDP-paratose 2-epimerase
MRILITGALGVVGSELARAYLAEGHEVRIIDAAEETRNLWMRQQILAEYPHADVWLQRLERCDVAELLDGVDQVIHAAASTGIPHSAINPNDDWVSNVDATRALLDGLRAHPVPTVVLSSVKPYLVPDLTGDHHGINEDIPLVPDEPYAASKAAQSMLAMAWSRSFDLPVVTLRCSNLYGPAPCHGPRHGWLTWFCISAAIGRPIEVQGSGMQGRDMLYTQDVLNACRAALGRADVLKGQVFNIGGGRSNIIRVGAAAQQLRSVTGVEITRGPGRVHEDPLVFADYSRFAAATGWRPDTPATLGMLRVLRWAQDHKTELANLYEAV